MRRRRSVPTPQRRRALSDRPSRDAELVALRVEHHDMVKVLTGGILADSRRSGGDQLGAFARLELSGTQIGARVPIRRGGAMCRDQSTVLSAVHSVAGSGSGLLVGEGGYGAGVAPEDVGRALAVVEVGPIELADVPELSIGDIHHAYSRGV